MKIIVSAKRKALSTSLIMALSAGATLSIIPFQAFSAYTVYCTNCATSSQGSSIVSNTDAISQYVKRLYDWTRGDQYMKLEQIRADIVDGIGQNATAIGTAVSQTGEILSNDRAGIDQFGQIIDAVKSRPKEHQIDCGNVGSGSAPSGTSQRGGGGGGGGGGGNYKGGKSEILKRAQRNAGLTDETPKLQEIPPNDVQTGMSAVGLCEDFADKNSTRGKICELTGAKTSSSEFVEADIDGNTLFIGPQKKADGKKVKRNSFAANSDEHKAMMASVNVLFATDVPPILPRHQAQTSAGAEYLGAVTKWYANRDLSRQVAQNRVDSFLIDEGTKTALKEAMKDPINANFLSQYLSDIDGWEKGVSTSLMRDIEVDKRASNPYWTEKVPSMDEAQRDNEMLYMQALQIKLTSELLDETITSNLLLAKILESNSGEMMRNIERAMVKAAGELANQSEFGGGND